MRSYEIKQLWDYEKFWKHSPGNRKWKQVDGILATLWNASWNSIPAHEYGIEGFDVPTRRSRLFFRQLLQKFWTQNSLRDTSKMLYLKILMILLIFMLYILVAILRGIRSANQMQSISKFLFWSKNNLQYICQQKTHFRDCAPWLKFKDNLYKNRFFKNVSFTTENTWRKKTKSYFINSIASNNYCKASNITPGIIRFFSLWRGGLYSRGL